MKILWIEDDYYAIKGLVRPLEQDKVVIDVATSALEGYQKAASWRDYDLMIVDLILPLSDADESLPEVVNAWDREQHVGLGLVKWLKQELKVECPVMLLSVVPNPVLAFNLQDLQLAGYLTKKGLLPSSVRDKVYSIVDNERQIHSKKV